MMLKLIPPDDSADPPVKHPRTRRDIPDDMPQLVGRLILTVPGGHPAL